MARSRDPVIVEVSIEEDWSNPVMLAKMMLDTYTPKKLRLLVANDNNFALMVICNSLKTLPFVESID